MSSTRRAGFARRLLLTATFAIAALLYCTAPVLAHDFWIEPSSFHPAPGDVVKVALRVGEHFKGEPVVRKSERIDKFILIGPDGEQPILGLDGSDPAGLTRVDKPGAYIIGYRSKHSSIELDAAKFEAYLKEEGLTAISELRAKRGQSDKPAKEIYSRSAKSLVQAGQPSASAHDRSIGFSVELIAEQNPFIAKPGDELTFQLLYESKPLEGVLVVGQNRDNPGARVESKTDAQGRVKLRLASTGAWLIKAVHMIEAPAGKGADWESLWASLTFELPVKAGEAGK